MIENKRVLVTGGAGFVGSHVTQQLLRRRAEIDVIDNFFTGNRDLIPEEATLYEADIRDTDALRSAITASDPDVIIHLAAIHYLPYCNSHPEETFDVNVRGTRQLLDTARNLDSLERVIFASSAAVYPPRNEPHAETDATGPIDIYGRTKLAGENLVERFSRETGISAASARLFNAYGQNETNPHLIPAIFNQLENGTKKIELGNLTPKRDFVHAGDVADALVALTADFDDSYRAFNVGTGVEWSIREVVEQVGDALNSSITIEQDEERARDSDRSHLCAETSRIQREMGWVPQTQFVDGLRMSLESQGLA